MCVSALTGIHLCYAGAHKRAGAMAAAPSARSRRRVVRVEARKVGQGSGHQDAFVRDPLPHIRVGVPRYPLLPCSYCMFKPCLLAFVQQVAVMGAAGGIGQPLSLLLKMNKFVTELALYDIANVAGVAADISHCNTPVRVRADRVQVLQLVAAMAVICAWPILAAPRELWDKSRSHCWPLAGHRVHRPRGACSVPEGCRPGGHPGGRAPQAGHDPRRPLQRQCRHRQGDRRGVRQELPRGRLLPLLLLLLLLAAHALHMRCTHACMQRNP